MLQTRRHLVETVYDLVCHASHILRSPLQLLFLALRLRRYLNRTAGGEVFVATLPDDLRDLLLRKTRLLLRRDVDGDSAAFVREELAASVTELGAGGGEALLANKQHVPNGIAPKQEAETARAVLARAPSVSVSESSAYRSTRSFYLSAGVGAWDDVPCAVTTNAFVARQLACLARSFLAESDSDQLVVVEMGAGHGQLGIMVARALNDVNGVRVVLTDFHEAVLGPLVDEINDDRVDSAVLDLATHEASSSRLRLRRAGVFLDEVVPQGTPIFAFAAYCFCSLPADIFLNDNGGKQLLEVRERCVDQGAPFRPWRQRLLVQPTEASSRYLAGSPASAALQAAIASDRTGFRIVPVGAAHAANALVSLARGGNVALAVLDARLDVSSVGLGVFHDQSLICLPEISPVPNAFALAVDFEMLRETISTAWISRGATSVLSTRRACDVVSLELYAATSANDGDSNVGGRLPRLREAFPSEIGPSEWHALAEIVRHVVASEEEEEEEEGGEEEETEENIDEEHHIKDDGEIADEGTLPSIRDEGNDSSSASTRWPSCDQLLALLEFGGDDADLFAKVKPCLIRRSKGLRQACARVAAAEARSRSLRGIVS
eukprot:TRINITY_DN40680_c0_g1_i1.p1 TRINITY_DN40680_c0_g1~~TRINITY_DN40680_c0_g1_i1.p1  ORF type:complete len:606 (-),score=113.96 TRINITY_DN40680_c0_g1_i1:7-1824(-)